MPPTHTANPPPFVTPEHLEKFHLELLAEFRAAVQATRLVKYYPTSAWDILVRNGVVDARIKQREWVVPGT